jgi:hypothetical protein
MTTWIQIAIAAIVGIFACVHYYYNIQKNKLDIKDKLPEATQSGILKFYRKYKQHLTVIVGVIAFSFLGFLCGKLTKPAYFSSKERIAILLPLLEDNKAAYQDGLRQLEGYIELVRSNPDLTDQFEFVLFDHKMSADVADGIIRKELQKGTRYFLCTMSSVCVPISEKFEKIVKECSIEGNQPILVSTVASSPMVSTSKNSKYRFYVRSQEEARYT